MDQFPKCQSYAIVIQRVNSEALEKSLSAAFGRYVRCRDFEKSSTGRAFLAAMDGQSWVVKVFTIDQLRVPKRAIDVLGALATHSLPTPQLTSTAPLLLSAHCAYSYEYIDGAIPESW